jgi:integrase
VALFNFAVDRQFLQSNPAKGIAKLKTPSVGFHTWTEDEAKMFEGRWPLGTRERLAFDLLIYTGVRRSDVVRLGRQHTKGGEITITTEKSRNSGRPVAVTITILPPLARSIAAGKTGDMAYLVTAKGTPFGKESFGTWFKKACVEAKVPGSSHGLRKLAAVRMAENGATEAELNAVFGWAEGSDESATYIRKANRAKLARAGVVKMLPQTKSQTSENNA